VQAELDYALEAVFVEDEGRFERPRREGREAVTDGEGTLPKRVADIAMARRDRRLHAPLLLA